MRSYVIFRGWTPFRRNDQWKNNIIIIQAREHTLSRSIDLLWCNTRDIKSIACNSCKWNWSLNVTRLSPNGKCLCVRKGWEDRGGRRSPRAMEGKGADNFHLRPLHRVHLYACELVCRRGTVSLRTLGCCTRTRTAHTFTRPVFLGHTNPAYGFL